MEDTSQGRVPYPEQRQEKILRLLDEQRQVKVSRLAEAFEVTTETIRRDLSELQRRQLIRRVHGGAMPWGSGRVTPLLTDRSGEHSMEKDRIARLAVRELPPEGEILLDSGSTVSHLARQIPLDSALTIVTNSLVNLRELSEHEQVRLVVLGGEVDRDTQAIVDAETVSAIRPLRVDTVVLGTDGTSAAGGLTTPTRPQAEVKRAMLRAARRVIVLVDGSKIGTDHFIRFAECREVDTIITDTSAPDDELALIQAEGTTVLRA